MHREGQHAGRGATPRPTGEGRRDYSAGSSISPDVPVLDDPALAAAAERASTLDAGWFRRHADRAHRVRRAIPNEIPPELQEFGPASWPVWVIVKRITPGVRLKVAYRAPQSPCTCRSCAARSWDQYAHPKAKALALDMAGIVLRHRG